jgi:hypothetical protein
MKMYSVKYYVNNDVDDVDDVDDTGNERSLNILAETFEDAFVLSKVRFPSMKVLAISINDEFEVTIDITKVEGIR